LRCLPPFALGLLATAVLASPARAADPIMPLSEVQPGMQCQALSVIRGVEPVPFGVEVLDIVEGDPSSDGPRILMRVFGSAVDETGIGPGFSGSPVYCPNRDGVAANIGAISESVGEYGGKVGLATPIEAILGNPVDVPSGAERNSSAARRGRKLAEPLTVSGLSRPLSSALTKAAAKRRRAVIASPAGPLRSFPPQVLRPGSAMGVGYASGDLTVGAVGTVAYVDGDRVWSFGHSLDTAGRRSLLLQDAYVYRVISNPLSVGDLGSTYKLAAASHDVGSLTNDAVSSVVGRLGAPPPTVPVRVTARDRDTTARQSVTTNVADETDVDEPLGSSLVSLIAPLAVTQAASGVLKSSPAKTSGDMCIAIRVRELRDPLRFCNRYVGDSAGLAAEGLGNVVATSAAADAESALSIISGYTGRALHVTSVDAGLRIERGADLAYMRDLDLPRRARAGQEVTARITVQRLRGPREVRRVKVRIPSDTERGVRRIILRGTDADFSEEALFEEIILDLDEEEEGARDREDESALDAGPQTLQQLREAVEGLERYDGVSLFVGRTRNGGTEAFRDPDVRLSGRVSGRIRIVRR